MRWLMVFVFSASPLLGDILYEEHFAGGVPSLDWYPFFEADPQFPDTMQVIADPSAPDGDGYVGLVTGPFVGMAFAGDPNLRNYSVEAWFYLTVTEGTGPYQGIGFRIDYTNAEFFNFIADLDQSRRLRLAHITSDFVPNVIKEWGEAEIPGGLPTEDGWHRMKVVAVEDSFWCYFDGQELPGSPYIYSEGPEVGYFGAYYFIFSGNSFVQVDSIIVKEAPEGIEERGITPLNYSVRVGPNPFRDRVVLEIRGKEGKSPIAIYSSSGRKVLLLSPEKIQGILRYIWNGRDGSGRKAAPGLYFLVLDDGSTSIPVIKLR